MSHTKEYYRLALKTASSLPLLYLESRRLLRSIPTLPEAKGVEGIVDLDFLDRCTVLFVGESTIAGVGVAHHREGFAGYFCQSMAEKIHANVGWMVAARSGYTVGKINREVLPNVPARKFDLIMVGVGANDAFKLSTVWKWRRDVKELIEQLRHKHSAAPIVFINTPPIEEFPVFSAQMKEVIGGLANVFSRELKELVEDYDDVFFNDQVLTIAEWESENGIGDPDYYFSDGVHPSAFTYRLWAEHMVDFVLAKKIKL